MALDYFSFFFQNVMCSFIPHQVGVFKVKQFIDIIGPVVDENLQSLSLKPFHRVYLDVNSVCKPCTKTVVMKINPGKLMCTLTFLKKISVGLS